jgi:hypothetical protein
MRVENMEEIVSALNDKVAETCTNFDEVKAYVDENMKVCVASAATLAFNATGLA